MLVFELPGGKKAIPNTEMDKLKREALKHIKYDQMTIKDLDKFVAYDPTVRFANQYRENADGSRDYLIGGVVNEFNTGSLPKRAYNVLHVEQPTSALSKWVPASHKSEFKLLNVPSTEIISTFAHSDSIESVEKLLELALKKGVNYFDHYSN